MRSKRWRRKVKKSIASTYGLGTEDTPMFPNMHEA